MLYTDYWLINRFFINAVVVTYYINGERENPKLLQIIINYGVSVSVIGSYSKKIPIRKIIKDKNVYENANL